MQPIDQSGVTEQLHGKVGTTNSSAEGGHQDCALVVFEISLNPQGCSSASSRYFGSGGGGLGLGRTWASAPGLDFAHFLMLCNMSGPRASNT